MKTALWISVLLTAHVSLRAQDLIIWGSVPNALTTKYGYNINLPRGMDSALKCFSVVDKKFEYEDLPPLVDSQKHNYYLQAKLLDNNCYPVLRDDWNLLSSTVSWYPRAATYSRQEFDAAVTEIKKQVKTSIDDANKTVTTVLDNIPQRLLSDAAKKDIADSIRADVKAQLDQLRKDLQQQIDELRQQSIDSKPK